VTSNQQLPKYQNEGYHIYPVVGISQHTNLTGRLAGASVTMLQTYKGEELGGDGTVPRFSAIPLELSQNPASAMYAATQHGSLQNADAVINDLIGLLSGFSIDLGSFREFKITTPVALEVEDVFFANDPIVVRARPSLNGDNLVLQASLWRSGATKPLAQENLQAASGDWYRAEFAPPGPGAYRVTVTGPKVETVEDSFVVAEIAAQDL
jgi:hypothetical protein